MTKLVSPGEAALRAYAEEVKTDRSGRSELWSRGFTRRRLVTGAAAGVSLAEHVVYEDAGRPERRGRGGPEE